MVLVAVIVVVNSDLDTKTNQGTLPYRVGAWLRRRWWKFAVVAAVVLVLVSLLNSNRQRSSSVPPTQRGKTVIPNGFVFNIEENRLLLDDPKALAISAGSRRMGPSGRPAAGCKSVSSTARGRLLRRSAWRI